MEDSDLVMDLINMRDVAREQPAFIYSYLFNTGELYRTNLATGEDFSHSIPSFIFGNGFCWSEIPGGVLLITGGRQTLSIDTRREFAVTHKRPMHTARTDHIAVYHAQNLYALGGYGPLRECERFVCDDNRWFAFPPMPTACWLLSGVVLEDTLYVIGGNHKVQDLDLIQVLDLSRLTWQRMQLKLPAVGTSIPCFKRGDSQAYFIINKKLYSFLPKTSQIKAIRTLSEGDQCSYYGPSYYSHGTLFCSNAFGKASRYKIGSLK
jgi:hypothetical protein